MLSKYKLSSIRGLIYESTDWNKRHCSAHTSCAYMYKNSFILKRGGGSSPKIKMCARICALRHLRHRIDFRARAFAASSPLAPKRLRSHAKPTYRGPRGRETSSGEFRRPVSSGRYTAPSDSCCRRPSLAARQSCVGRWAARVCARLLYRGCGCTVIYWSELFFRFGFEVRGWLGFGEVVISDCEGTFSRPSFRLPFAVIMPRFVFVYNFDDTSNLLRLKCPEA